MPEPAAHLDEHVSSPTKPRMRGVSHELATFVAVPAALLLVARAAGPAARVGAAIYGFTLVALFAVSAVYHRRLWSLPVRQIIGRLDHSAIFLLIAGTYTPFGLALGPGPGHVALWVVWLGALAGIVLVVGFRVGKRTRAGIYVLLGWVALPILSHLHEVLGQGPLLLLLLGGFFYTVGAVVYGARRPDPFPRTFGFHEIFHLLTIAAAACHYAVVMAAVDALGRR
jgi:hemolysin III